VPCKNQNWSRSWFAPFIWFAQLKGEDDTWLDTRAGWICISIARTLLFSEAKGLRQSFVSLREVFRDVIQSSSEMRAKMFPHYQRLHNFASDYNFCRIAEKLHRIPTKVDYTSCFRKHFKKFTGWKVRERKRKRFPVKGLTLGLARRNAIKKAILSSVPLWVCEKDRLANLEQFQLALIRRCHQFANANNKSVGNHFNKCQRLRFFVIFHLRMVFVANNF